MKSSHSEGVKTSREAHIEFAVWQIYRVAKQHIEREAHIDKGAVAAQIIYTHMVSDDIPPLADDMPRFAWMIYKAFALMIYRLWRMKSSHGEGDICRGGVLPPALFIRKAKRWLHLAFLREEGGTL